MKTAHHPANDVGISGKFSPESFPLLRKHMPELDVLRGLAILMVVIYHGLYFSGVVSSSRIGTLIVKASVSGWLGVNLFFVLSGFLITGILIDTKSHPTYYRRFYFRRVRRILPVYFLTIAVLIFLHTLTFGSTMVALAFLANYHIFPVVGGFGPFWSLSVEEQFYLLWPTVVGRIGIRSLTILSLTLCVIEPVLRWLTFSYHLPLGDVHSSTLLIADNLALGALAAIFARSRYGSIKNGMKFGLAMMVAGLVILISGLPFGIISRTNAFGATLQTVPWNLFFTGSLIFLLALQNSFFAGIWPAPLRFLGYISYGLYLYHLIVFGIYDKLVNHVSSSSVQTVLRDGFMRLFLAGSLAIFIAWLSRKFFEEYFLRRKLQSSAAQPQ
ncbi:MAG: acyltransferase [Edaphobacter sp.]